MTSGGLGALGKPGAPGPFLLWGVELEIAMAEVSRICTVMRGSRKIVRMVVEPSVHVGIDLSEEEYAAFRHILSCWRAGSRGLCDYRAGAVDLADRLFEQLGPLGPL